LITLKKNCLRSRPLFITSSRRTAEGSKISYTGGPARKQECVSDSLFHDQGVGRVVFEPNTVGKGVNLQGICQVIHYGPHTQVDDLLRRNGCNS